MDSRYVDRGVPDGEELNDYARGRLDAGDRRCTCKNQTTYYGSYFCTQDSTCRKAQDVKWWGRVLRESH